MVQFQPATAVTAAATLALVSTDNSEASGSAWASVFCSQGEDRRCGGSTNTVVKWSGWLDAQPEGRGLHSEADCLSANRRDITYLLIDSSDADDRPPEYFEVLLFGRITY